MDGLFCNLSFFMFLTLRLVKQFVQKKLVVEFNPVAADVSPLHLKSFRKNNEPTHVGCYKILRQLRILRATTILCFAAKSVTFPPCSV
jgi:hypothetical protein